VQERSSRNIGWVEFAAPKYAVCSGTTPSMEKDTGLTSMEETYRYV